MFFRAAYLPHRAARSPISFYTIRDGPGPSRVERPSISGGVAGDPSGATLLCDFGLISSVSSTAGWYGMVATYGLTATGHINAGARVWIRYKTDSAGIYFANDSRGDLDSGYETSSIANTPSIAFASTWESDAGSAPATRR